MRGAESIKLKVCGMKSPPNLQDLVALQPDYIGFIFYPGSPRYIVHELDHETVRQLPDTIQKVGVFVNEPLETVMAYGEQYGLNAVQLHGSESPEYCKACRKRFTVIKAFAVSDEFDFEVPKQYDDMVDFFLFDTKTKKYGGSGRQFDWTLLEDYPLKTPFFLSGGIGAEDVRKIIEADLPKLYAIDINSKVELAPGKKDLDKVKAVINKLRSISTL